MVEAEIYGCVLLPPQKKSGSERKSCPLDFCTRTVGTPSRCMHRMTCASALAIQQNDIMVIKRMYLVYIRTGKATAAGCARTPLHKVKYTAQTTVLENARLSTFRWAIRFLFSMIECR